MFGGIDGMNKPVLSLCMPTNGIIEWVFPVLDSIYAQNADPDKYEIVVTNNGNNDAFHQMMLRYERQHSNLIYKKTDAYLFDNQLETLKLAKGKYLKFINHRGLFTDGALDFLIRTIEENAEEKPVIYFSNGVLKRDCVCDSFDGFVAGLLRNVSWTTGVGIWKSDYEKIPDNQVYDKISPHSAILFSERKKKKYLILNTQFCREIDADHSNKGKYDLFKAFAVEEPLIALKLYVDGDISTTTFKAVKADYKDFVASLYWDFCVRKKPCSYDLKGFEDAMGIFFNKYEIIARSYLLGMKYIIRKILRR